MKRNARRNEPQALFDVPPSPEARDDRSMAAAAERSPGLWQRLMPGVRGRLVHGAVWSAASTAGGQILALVASILTARVLGQSAFGELGIVRNTLVMLSVLAGSGLGVVATRYVAQHRTSDPDRAGRLLGLVLLATLVTGTLAMVLCGLLAPAIASGTLHTPWLTRPLRVASPLLLLQTINGVLLGALLGFEAFRTAAATVIVDGAAALAGTVAGAMLLGVSGSVAGSVGALLIGVPVKVVAVRRRCRREGIRLALARDRLELRELWVFCIPAMLVGISSQPFAWLARAIIVRQPGGLGEFGLFSAAFTWGQIALLAASQVAGPSVPIMANLFGSARQREFRESVRSVIRGTMAVGAIVAVPLVLGSKAILAVYGPDYPRGWPVLAITVAAHGLGAGTYAYGSLFIAIGRMWWQALHACVFGAVLIGVTLLLAGWGALGLAIAYLVAYTAFVGVQMAFYHFGVVGPASPTAGAPDPIPLPAIPLDPAGDPA